MGHPTKRTFALALLSLILLQVLAPATLFIAININKYAQQKLIREKYLEPSFFQTIILDQAAYNNLVFIDKHEIIYQGELYDIQSIRQKAGNYTLVALADKTEAKLKEVSSTLGHQNQAGKSLLSAFNLLFYEELALMLPTAPNFPQTCQESAKSSLLAQAASVPAPPPDQSC